MTSATASISSPSRAVDGVVSRSTRTSSRSTSPITCVSTWIPRAAASAASCWPRPVVSLPSEIRTIRFWAASGNSAEASRSAPPMSVAPLTGVLREPVDLAQVLRQPLDERVLAERDDPGLVPLGHHLEGVAQEREGVLAAARADAVRQVDDEDGGEPIDREHELEAGEGEDEGRRSRVRMNRAARRRPAPIRRRAARCGTNVMSSAGTRSSSQIGASKRMPISAPLRAARAVPRRPRHSRVTASRWYTSHSARSTTSTTSTITDPQLVARGRAFVGHDAAGCRGRAGLGGPAGVGAGLVLGPPDASGWRPSVVIAATEPGAMSLSPGSNRSTANRIGALGSAGGAVGTGGLTRRPAPRVTGGSDDAPVVAGGAVRRRSGPASGSGRPAPPCRCPARPSG